MRKTTLFILLVFYMVAATGATINFHYCMDKLVGTQLQDFSSENCSKCQSSDSNDNNNCCKKEYKLVKIDLDHKNTVASLELVKIASSSDEQCFPHLVDLDISSITEDHPSSNAPPPGCLTALYKRNCTYLI